MSRVPSRAWSVPTTTLALFLVCLSGMLFPMAARAANAVDTLGVYAGGGAPDAVEAFSAKLGRPVENVHDTFSRESWDELTDINWFMDQWRGTRFENRVVYTVGMLPNEGASLAAGATGAYDEQWKTLARKLVAGGQGSATMRIGPEFNGYWFTWSISKGGAANYIAYWRHIVDAMRSVDGAHFRFDWCPNAGSSWVDGKQLDAASAYPGDSYVDYIGLDVYDQSWIPKHADPVARWADFLTMKDGLNWHRDFAAAHGKPMTFPEWGLAQRQDEFGGGDNPYFIEQMYNWIATNDVAYHLYFDYSDGTTDSILFDGKFPRAARRFVELFGAGSNGRPTSSAATDPAASQTTPAAAPLVTADGAKGLASFGQASARRLKVHSGRISQAHRRLKLRAKVHGASRGRIRIVLQTAQRSWRYSAKIKRSGQVRLSRRVPRAAALAPTGLIVRYRAESVRLTPRTR